MVVRICFLIIPLMGSFTVAVDLASPEVFNANFYISNNVEVLRAGVRDAGAARNHWLQHGINMGLQASGNFHSKQYLKRYQDLTDAFHNNYHQAVQHYLTNGISEKRVGYVEGEFEGRWTVSDSHHRLFVRASRRMGGAIDSLVWNNHEFINSWDHGRELQMAMNFVPNGECYNPTEAGGRDDGQAPTTHTLIQSVTAHGDQLHTQVHPAFWLQPGDTETINAGTNCHQGSPALNTDFEYHYPFSKTVKLACPKVSTPCLVYNSSFTIAGNIPQWDTLQMEAPTGYLTGDFTKIQSVNPQNGHLEAYNNRKPVVMSTQDDQFAMGVYAPPGQTSASDPFFYYGTHKFPNSVSPAATNKWNVVYRKHHFSTSGGGSHVLNYHVYICVGTTHDVAECLKTLIGVHENNLIG